MPKSTSVGGQAVIEGVMMRGTSGIATAVRKSDGDIAVDRTDCIPYNKRNKFFALPVIRGFIALIESLIVGINTLNYSATFFAEDEEPSKFDNWIKKIFKDKSDDVILGITLCISLGVAIMIFFIFPTFLANIFKKTGINTSIGLNILEGVIRVIIFLIYIYLIGRMPDIKRLFQYHGAEHKTIFCYENKCDLTPENAKKFGRLHPRCGTNFLFLVMIVSIILFSLTGWHNIWQRILYRIALLPVVSGITYELIKWMGTSNNIVSKVLAYPGLMLQKLTTQEPDCEQLEVAITALKYAEGMEEDNK
ncbi:DUF1385 domain-containing protein [Clostridium tyrobutyricum]|jgi:uncharacterized protein YqhQ|uniref:DUF1385 domain-containing protein n=1 Tax=Clostridium tyrobutyricum DIVETGP TaxID=1408889 RepID=W6N6X2_CLOTY|nr:DUF1385 domain-containing protein [Clostridium tyrobutyricum]AND83403.1 hypothetical protein CTK_C01330 [Clostridium tyrobutyricum]ANP68203.1 hypothetical protein BA182_00475 [Clostridium tyrobutyricum]MBR9648867.1 DUF1385 domain-containing protein [Clostridium tyrobutyricum]MBV4421499.1 DUF1385 domain-containing protein [Clostridium tyrobutyricum]MBV4424645.1 DUF1385 domain-containing protein [Clostridium tyrobutyricum]